MKLQELITQNDLDMNINHIKAFFLGVMSAQKPMPFKNAVEEMLTEAPEAAKALNDELKNLWDDLQKNKPAELQKLFPENSNTVEFLSNAKEQLDFFLTALALSGTHAETIENEDLADLVDELEDTVMDLDEYLTEETNEAESAEFKELLLETWQDYLRTSKL